MIGRRCCQLTPSAPWAVLALLKLRGQSMISVMADGSAIRPHRSDPTTATIQGAVIDAATGAAVAGRPVLLEHTDIAA